MTEELSPCPKCGHIPNLAISYGPPKFSYRVICTHCGLHTADFTDKVPAGSLPGDMEIFNQVRQQAVDAWEGGKFAHTVEDLSINREKLAGVYHLLGSFLEEAASLEPEKRVLRFDEIRRELNNSTRKIRKEVVDGA